MIKNFLGIVAFIVISISLFFNFRLSQSLQKANKPFTVKTVIDGDSFILESGQKIRLLGSDSPEIGFCGSLEAKKRLEELILGKIIRLEEIRNDIYGRQIALVYVGQILINEKMLEEGWSRNESAYGSKLKLLQEAHKRGLNKRKGIFSPLCRIESPPDKNCLIKANINARKQKYYFFPGCYEYNQAIVEKDLGEDWYCTEKEIINLGFKKPKNCPEKYK